jgi:hypothetical protein
MTELSRGVQTKQKNPETTYSGFTYRHTKKAMTTVFSKFVFQGLNYYISTYLEGLRKKAVGQDPPGFEPSTSQMQFNICTAMPACSVTRFEVECYYIGEGRWNMYSKY